MQDLRTRREFAESQAAWPGPIAPAALAVTFVAEVLALDAPHGFVLDAGAGKCIGHCAAGCLLVPEVGDQVACWYGAAPHHAPAQAYIVSVLVRADPARQATLALHGDTLIDCRAGTLTLKATTAIAVETPRCAVHADDLSLQARAASLVVQAWTSIAGRCAATVGQLRLVGETLSTVFERQTHHAQHCRRQVDGMDQLEAQVIEHKAHDLLHLHGENLLVNGDRLIKLKSAQVHLG